MKHSLAFALSLMLVSGTALADDRLIGADVEKALEQSSAQMNKSVEQMNAAFEKVMPELPQHGTDHVTAAGIDYAGNAGHGKQSNFFQGFRTVVQRRRPFGR